MDEKLLPTPRTRFSAVGFCLTALRIWQWSSSFFVYASLGLLYDHIQRNRLGVDERMKGVQVLGLVTLVYSTITLCCVHVFKTLDIRAWRVFAVMSVPGDLTIMGICLANISILAFSGLPADCHGLTRDTYNGNDLVRQPADGFTTIRFGSWSHDIPGELDGLCTFPRTVYGLSVAAIFAYTFSILLSVLYLQRQEPELFGAVTAIQGLVARDEESAPDIHHGYATRPFTRPASPAGSRPHSPTPSYCSRGSRQPDLAGAGLRGGSASNNGSSPSSRAPSFTSRTLSVSSETYTWGATTLGSDSDSIRSGISLQDSESFVSGGSLPPPPLPGSSAHVPQRRWSSSTNSSYNANAFIVTDGFRPGGELPTYSSRPGSLYHESVKYEAGLTFPNCKSP